jgi:hypothetical protein
MMPDYTAVARQGRGKHISAATNTHATEEPLQAVLVKFIFQFSGNCRRKEEDDFYQVKNKAGFRLLNTIHVFRCSCLKVRQQQNNIHRLLELSRS